MTSQNCCVGPAIKDFARVSYLNYHGNTSQLPETIYCVVLIGLPTGNLNSSAIPQNENCSP